MGSDVQEMETDPELRNINMATILKARIRKQKQTEKVEATVEENVARIALLCKVERLSSIVWLYFAGNGTKEEEGATAL